MENSFEFEQNHIATARFSQEMIKKMHKKNQAKCIAVRDIESDDGGYVFAEYHTKNKNDIKEVAHYVKFINSVIETSIYKGYGYIDMPECIKSFGLLAIYPNDYLLDEAKVKYFKNPDGALKNKITRSKSRNKKLNKIVKPLPKRRLSSKQEDVDDIEEIEESVDEDMIKAANDAKTILYKEIHACRDGAQAYYNIMQPYAKNTNSFAIAGWNIQKLEKSERDYFPENRSAVFKYSSKIFNDTHSSYIMDMDDNCIYITKK